MCHRIRQEYDICAGWYGMVCCGMYGMMGFSDVMCDAMVLMVWLVSHWMRCWRLCRVGARDHVARLVRRCGMALGAATAAAVRILRWLGFWRTRP